MRRREQQFIAAMAKKHFSQCFRKQVVRLRGGVIVTLMLRYDLQAWNEEQVARHRRRGVVPMLHLLVIPAGAGPGKPVPLVIAQQGIGSHPERTFGVLDEGGHSHRFSAELVRAAFAALAPMNLRSIERRNRLERLCRLAGTSLPGLELVRVQRLPDEVLQDPRIDSQRVGMWGGGSPGRSALAVWRRQLRTARQPGLTSRDVKTG